MGLGDSYLKGYWECRDLEGFFDKIIRAGLDRKAGTLVPALITALNFSLRNMQKVSRAFQVAEAHYNLGNDLFEAMLGPTMAYSCAYFENATTLDEAQYSKFDLVCRKLHLSRGDRVLDIGCGWGGLAKYMAERYGVHVIGITVSDEQAKYASNLCRGLNVQILTKDYRSSDLSLMSRFDAVVSIGMFEHVGSKNYREFFEIARRHMWNNGTCLIQTIGRIRGNGVDPWLQKHIFPNGMLPDMVEITNATRGLLILEDLQNLSTNYETTALHWEARFTEAWPSLKDKYGEEFYRMWRYYLLSCAGSFRARNIQLWQLVFSPEDAPNQGYHSVR